MELLALRIPKYGLVWFVFSNKHTAAALVFFFLYKDFEIDIFNRDISDKVGDLYSVDHVDVKKKYHFLLVS